MADTPNLSTLWQAAAAEAVRYREGTADRVHRATQGYAETLAAFDGVLPDEGRPAGEVISHLVRAAEPGLQASTGPRFHGWVIGGSHPVGVAADWLTAAWGQNAGNPLASPAASACETVAQRWLLELLDLPRAASVGFVTGATVANFVCLAAARGELLRRAGWDLDAQGLFGAPPIHVLIGEDAHATVYMALSYLGLGQQRVIRVACDAQGRMRPDALAQALPRDGSPAMLILQAGQINSGAFDPFTELIPLARERGAWVHVDGAFGLWARASPARAALAQGVELADSWATDGHKWLQTPYDSGFAIVADESAHRRAMTIAASYLPVAGGVRDPSHFVPELSRRARGFAAWTMMAHLGRQGVAKIVERNCRQAKLIAATARVEPGIEVCNDVVLNQATLRFGGEAGQDAGDRLTRAVIARVVAAGECFVDGAQWRGRWVMRVSVSNAATTDDDARRTARAIITTWRAVRGEERAA